MNMNCTEENKKGCRFAIYDANTGESIYEYFYENDQDIKHGGGLKKRPYKKKDCLVFFLI